MQELGTIAVIGLGYIGLPTAAAIAARGHRVVGVDVNESTVSAVSEGRVPFVEPDLGGVVEKAVADGLLTATTEMPEADAYVVAVPTPFLDDKSADLSYIKAASEAIAPRLRGGEIVILESTSPPGATEQMGEWLLAARPDLAVAGTGDGRPEVFLAHCPERVLPGRIMVEIVENDRVIGGVTPACAERAADVYRIFCRGELLTTDARTAELCKLVENSFRDVNIAFANELAGICDELGIDVWRLIELANRHPRVNILKPGPGVGGHCIAVDPWFIVAAAPGRSALIRQARETNDARPAQVVDKVRAALPEGRSATVAALGLAFKADVDDLRESPALHVAGEIADMLGEEGTLVAVEPHVEALPRSLANRRNVELADLSTALERADVLVLLVDHKEFAGVDAGQIGGKAVVDTRGQWRHVVAAR
ncbi:UDP-N-acetyl-D-mannosamine dehydrogenase [Aquipuribacter nitratireducens]|uniref:UDP-N-acetyl-D-mannosamine dehydrogenase n=1 Tax=Aquipuribacter nitratireducens TaxID=650104 RepID=A0ABW0GID1_9MICO